jgi:hypothetical protein
MQNRVCSIFRFPLRALPAWPFRQRVADIVAPICICPNSDAQFALTSLGFSKMSTADIIAYVDEAGEKGLIRNLTPDRDPKVALFAALLFSGSRINELQTAFEPAFIRFKNEGGARLEKFHITEAFKPGNEDLRPMAEEVRDKIFQQLEENLIPIVYTARRIRLLREGFSLMEQNFKFAEKQAEALRAGRPRTIAVPDRPGDERIEEDLAGGLTLKLDAYATDFGLKLIDLVTDEMDSPIAKKLNVRMEEMRSISYQQTTVKAFDLTARKPAPIKIIFGVKNPPFPLDVTHLGQLMVVGKDDPLVFAADVVANALNNHLSDIPSDAPLNAPSSIEGWILRDRVWGARDGAIEENIPAVW